VKLTELENGHHSPSSTEIMNASKYRPTQSVVSLWRDA